MTISIDDLKRVRTIITHEGCPDGIASAILLHDALPDATIRFCQYGTKEHAGMAEEDDMLFCDFSPHPDRVEDFVAARSIVLDHHKSAKAIVERFGERGVFADEEHEPGVSGAVLAFRHVWLPLLDGTAYQDDVSRARVFATLAGIRDTWQRKDICWSEACAQAAMLRFYPTRDWLDVDQPFSLMRVKLWMERMNVGRIVEANHAARVERAVARALRGMTSDGTRVVIFQGVELTSDAAELLGDAADLVIGFAYESEGGREKLIVSTRSHTTFDCAAFARHHGGGGHTRAAGFTQRVIREDPNPYALLLGLVQGYEHWKAVAR